jgi:hypothetical protein
MSDPILFSQDPDARTVDYFHDLGDGEYVIETRQDVTGLVEFNKALQNANTGRWGEMAHVAQIPLTVLEDLQRKGVIDSMWNLKDEPGFRKWLNSPENRVFRTKLGKV